VTDTSTVVVKQHHVPISQVPRSVQPVLTASVAVVGCAEDRDHVLLMAPVVSLHDQLVCAADEVQPIGVVELLTDVLGSGRGKAREGGGGVKVG
jgi:hypothetical protein